MLLLLRAAAPLRTGAASLLMSCRPALSTTHCLPRHGSLHPPALQQQQSRTFSTCGEGKPLGPEDIGQSGQKWQVLTPLKAPQLLGVYSDLIKLRLSGLVVLTTMVGYAMAPASLNVGTLAATTIGTALCVCAANAFNQLAEVPYDAQMKRTKVRPLVKHLISPFHAFSLGTACAVVGVGTLACLVNPVTATLGAANIVLYAGIYTPMKRTSIVNTWVGSVVGALPPMMGWAAATGGLETGAWVLAAILYAWQFPHFNSLSWNLREEYSRAGYRMMSATDPGLCRRVALRYSLAMFPICLAAPLLDMTTWYFAADSSAVNLALAAMAWRFYSKPGEDTARRLFMLSVIHLPILLVLLMLHKKGQPKAAVEEEDEEGDAKGKGELAAATAKRS